MRIGVDAYITSPGQGGFTSYITRIVRHLSATGEDDLLVYTPAESVTSLTELDGLPRVELRPIPFDMNGFANRTERDTTWHQQALVSALQADRPDVCFGTCQFLPLSWPGPSVVTIHDVIFERHPEFFTPGNLDLYRTWTRRAALRADAILTVSQASADDVRDVYPVGDKPVVATPLGSALAFVPEDRDESRRIVADRLGVEGGYVLNVASHHRRKNLPGALRAFAALPENLRSKHRLVLMNLASPYVADLVREYGIEEHTVVTERLPSDLVPHVYTAAAVLVHPSFYEGFGLPVLEAMACGTPVVSSTAPAIPEIADGAAVLVDPHDDAALASALESLLTDPDRWDALSAAGRERSRTFDWARTAATTRETLALVASKPG